MKPVIGVLAWLVAVLPMTVAAEVEPATEMAESMPLAASRSLMLDIAESRARAVVVGERGHILVSESRSEWRQVDKVPTRATLTAVSAVGDKVWAAGHDGIILHSADGGLTWSVQREDRWREASLDDEEWNPRQGAPLLDILFVDEQRGFAVGAYSMLLVTDDGGSNWRQVPLVDDNAGDEAAAAAADAMGDDQWTFDADDLELDEETDPHLNGIARTPSGLMLLVAERGSAFRSRDDGATWERISLPYDGSMFGVLVLGDQHLLAYGLRGNVLETRDGGDTWTVLETGTELSLMGGVALADGGALLIGANGVVLYRESADRPLRRTTFENSAGETPVLASALALGERTFLLAGDKGMSRLEVRN